MNTVSRFALAWPSYEKCNETEITTTWASRYGPFPPRRGGAHRLVLNRKEVPARFFRGDAPLPTLSHRLLRPAARARFAASERVARVA